ncbi:MAG: DUF4062 domain-containing protein [Planctomycetes bacterium]|nr:DUF4062 domain-containing protein [Planctomycetota bacterium]
MDKRFQVFVSSTFRDLFDERREVIQAILEIDCIPSGMELFPAANDESWQLIKRVIEESDYYCLIIGGKYGSVDKDGISFTEREYDYAIQAGIPILAFLHGQPDEIPHGKSERDPVALARLAGFRQKVMKDHICKEWTNAADLGAKVSRGLIKEIRSNPRVGWIRADQLKMLQDTTETRRRVEKLEQDVQKSNVAEIRRLAEGPEYIPFQFEYSLYTDGKKWENHTERIPMTWDDVFIAIGPVIFIGASTTTTRTTLSYRIQDIKQKDEEFRSLKTQSYQIQYQDMLRMLIQLSALGLIEPDAGASDRWKLTSEGRNYLVRQLGIQSDIQGSPPKDAS